MKPVVLHPDARAELREAAAFYEDRRAGLGREFRGEFERAAQVIQENPQLYGLYKDTNFRACVLRRFSYVVFYQELEDCIWIAAVSHSKRRPDHWIRRTPD